MTAKEKNCADINAIADTTTLEISFSKHVNRKKEKFNTKISVKYLILDLSSIDRYNLSTIRDEMSIIFVRYYFKLTKKRETKRTQRIVN